MSIRLKNYQISKSEFLSRLQSNPFEDLSVVKSVEKYFSKIYSGGYELPPKGSSVVLLASGGIDSTVAWEILINHFEYEVFPVFIVKDSKLLENHLKSARYFSNYFLNKYPKYSRELLTIDTKLLPKKFYDLLSDASLLRNSEVFSIFEGLLTGKPSNLDQGIQVVPYLNSFYGLLYAHFLNTRKGKNIDYIFSGILAGDGVSVPSQTYSSLLISSQTLHLLSGRKREWRHASIFMNLKSGIWIDKKDCVAIGNEFGLELEKTWSCLVNKKYHCGKCFGCLSRKGGFVKSGVKDKTKYLASKPSFTSNFKLNWGIKRKLRLWFGL